MLKVKKKWADRKKARNMVNIKKRKKKKKNMEG